MSRSATASSPWMDLGLSLWGDGRSGGVILINLFLRLSSAPVFEFKPLPKQHSAVA